MFVDNHLNDAGPQMDKVRATQKFYLVDCRTYCDVGLVDCGRQSEITLIH